MSTNKNTGKARAPVVVEDDDENLDDLDDVLQEFTKPPPAKKPVPPPAAPSAPKAAQPSEPKKDDGPGEALDEEFERELMEGMEKLMAELTGAAPDKSGDPATTDEAFRKAWESMVIGDLEGTGGADDNSPFDALKNLSLGAGEKAKQPAAGGSSKSGPSAPPADDFQNAIKQTLEKLRSSDDAAKADAASSSNPLMEMMAALGDMGGEGGGEGGPLDMQEMLETMMSQLMSKELLYEPLKELNTKFPEYLAKNEATLPPDDLKKYKAQQECVAKTVKLFEDPSYSDEDAEKSAEVLKIMTEMQSLGSPPAEIMGELPPGFNLGADGLPSLGDGEGCVIA